MDARRYFAACTALIALTTCLLVSRPSLAGGPVLVVRDVAAGVPVIAVEIDLSVPTTYVTATMATGGSGHAKSWSKMIDRTQPYVAITGTYFDVASRVPIGDLYIDGKLAHFGGLGTALCVTDDNRASFVNVPLNHHIDWSKYDFVIRCGPSSWATA